MPKFWPYNVLCDSLWNTLKNSECHPHGLANALVSKLTEPHPKPEPDPEETGFFSSFFASEETHEVKPFEAEKDESPGLFDIFSPADDSPVEDEISSSSMPVQAKPDKVVDECEGAGCTSVWGRIFKFLPPILASRAFLITFAVAYPGYRTFCTLRDRTKEIGKWVCYWMICANVLLLDAVLRHFTSSGHLLSNLLFIAILYWCMVPGYLSGSSLLHKKVVRPIVQKVTGGKKAKYDKPASRAASSSSSTSTVSGSRSMKPRSAGTRRSMSTHVYDEIQLPSDYFDNRHIYDPDYPESEPDSVKRLARLSAMTATERELKEELLTFQGGHSSVADIVEESGDTTNTLDTR